MNILFLHRSFPAQFKYLVTELAKNSQNRVVFVTNTEMFDIKGVEKILYKLEINAQANTMPYLSSYESAFAHGKAVADVVQKLKNKGFIPDIIYGHSGWGVTLFMKDVFPDVPLVCYFEWFQNADGADTGFGGVQIDENQRAGLRCSNSQVLVDLCSCDGGISPTQWQKSQFPKEFHDKIKVISDGFDTEFFKPDNNVKFLVHWGFHSKPDLQHESRLGLLTQQQKAENALNVSPIMELSAKDEVITYATRGMEPYRGFEQFMEAVEKLLSKRPNLHVLIAGEDKVFYRGKLENVSYKKLMLEKLNLDMNRVHFVGALSYVEYLKLLQISSAHIYLTVPYVISWSFLEAMSTGCCVVASSTPPVLEFIKDNYNGLLFDFFNVNQLVEKVEYALDNKIKMQEIRKNARKTIIDEYSLDLCLPAQMDYLSSI